MSEQVDGKKMFVQNCVDNVYPKGNVTNVTPIQNNTCPSPDFDAGFAKDLPYFDIVYLIPPVCLYTWLVFFSDY